MQHPQRAVLQAYILLFLPAWQTNLIYPAPPILQTSNMEKWRFGAKSGATSLSDPERGSGVRNI